MKARFVLSRKDVLKQYKILRDLNVHVSYSFKTNREVGKVLEKETDSDFSIHIPDEIDMLEDKKRIWFFSQAWNSDEIKEILRKGVRNFVIDNEIDLDVLLDVLNEVNVKVNLLLRMKFQEHRIGTGKYFAYGMSARKVNEVISGIGEKEYIEKIGVHLHRKSQNTTEWEIKQELIDSFNEDVLKRINIVNLGGGLPVRYRSYTMDILPYIFKKIKEARDWLAERNIEVYVEPGRFICGPAVKLEAEIIQVYDNIIVINTSLYNCALDTLLTQTKMLVEGEIDEKARNENDLGAKGYSGGEEKGGDIKEYLIKGNSPTRDDIFRYRVKLKAPKVGQKIVFLNAGAYNYTTDFCSFKKLEYVIVN